MTTRPPRTNTQVSSISPDEVCNVPATAVLGNPDVPGSAANTAGASG